MNNLRIHYIYMITNKINGKTYIGKRICKNKTMMPERDNYMGSGVAIRFAEEKYGMKNFHKDILAICYNKEELSILEKQYIKLYREIGKAEYNISDGGDGGGHGPTSPETIEKIRKSNLGQKRSEETKKKLSEFHKNRSDETKKKISDSLKGKKRGQLDDKWKSNISKGLRSSEKRCEVMHSEEFRRKASESHKGKVSPTKGMKYSKEHNEKVSQRFRELYNSPRGDIVRAKLRAASTGRTLGEESRRKISEANKGRVVSLETREKLRNANLGKKHTEKTKLLIKEKRALQAPRTKEQEEKRLQHLSEYWNSPEGLTKKKELSEKGKMQKHTEGLHWFNNGVKNVKAKECPEGYIPGRLGDFTCSEESKKKKSEWYHNLSDEERKAYKEHLSESHKGKSCSEERKRRISEAKKGTPGRPQSDDIKDKISAGMKGKKRFTNGITEVRAYECPEGFVPGTLKGYLKKNSNIENKK